ncbi:helix-turn-helix transcriptional regulator [Methylobacterium brachythecii]|uniref:DNA-binding CsgD family transcriptional regulator n=1 Tax=Methylobacterium brachythecii TaxID=1176177 RepID=A0A7W6AHV4_9HYPH|nr:helix-turn-helix transcriptional regulator [Methylobacterium brachythecii]MBB3901469.1 DNA-binding CsgD family transcriptional regulator [Methylobacterium brachythecii]GLS43041.1 LuxR family transcriptional regulator [Methylobacterium brachythecii]
MARGTGRFDIEAMTDKIYEASVVPEAWTPVLDSMTEIAGGVGTILLAADTTDFRFISTNGLAGFVESFVEQGWPDKNTRTPAVLKARHAGFIVESDVYTPEQIESDPLINQFLRPQGLGWATATAFPMTTGDTLVFSIERAFRDGPVPPEAVSILDSVRPHLGRAALISGRLRLERARAAVETLALLGLPAGIIRRDSRLQAANTLLDALIPRTVRDGGTRVAFADGDADDLLAAALNAASRQVPRSIPIPARDNNPAMVAHLVPVRGVARDLFTGSAFILVLTPVEMNAQAPDADLLQGLFDLTAAEARVARAIVAGETVETIILRQGVSESTVRTQLKSVFAKTGMKGQLDLVRLGSGLNLVRSDDI